MSARKFRTFVLIVIPIIMLNGYTTVSAPLASTYQVLEPKLGYVPVYIRKGDTPLEEINLQLAEAFRSLEEKSSHQKSIEHETHILSLLNRNKNEIIDKSE